MVFNRSFTSSGSWSTNGEGGDVTFDTATDPVVQAKVGISYVSTADAVLNRRVENPGWNFQSVRKAAYRTWSSLLGRVQIAGGTTAQQATFYTALYHSLLQPNVFNDVNGQYMGYDGKVQKVDPGQKTEYTNFSEWDISRSEIQLLSLLVPNRMDDMITSMLNDDTQTGHLPKWSEDDSEGYAMVGDPADDVIADAYAFGARNFNVQQALEDMERQADVPSDIRPGLDYYERDGYLPINGKYGCCDYNAPVSTQEQYNVDDNSIAELASELGENGVAKKFATRAQNWQNVFDPASGFMEPKLLNGAFEPGSGPEPGFGPNPLNGFTETDSFVSTTMIPFDVKGLVDAEGGDEAWIELLNGLTSSVVADGTNQVQMGDEPSFGVPWEYDYVGVPFKTQEVVREIQDQDYADSPTGLAGNDDLGEMSSWYVWSALGAYPENPGSSEVVLGSPLFKDIVFHLGDGGTITENAPAAADNAPYVQSLTVNGTSWTRTYLRSSVFTKGGTLDWTLATSPSTTWGAAAKDAPPSSTEGLLPALGYVSNSNGESRRGPRIEREHLARRPEHVQGFPAHQLERDVGIRLRHRRGAGCRNPDGQERVQVRGADPSTRPGDHAGRDVHGDLRPSHGQRHRPSGRRHRGRGSLSRQEVWNSASRPGPGGGARSSTMASTLGPGRGWCDPVRCQARVSPVVAPVARWPVE